MTANGASQPFDPAAEATDPLRLSGENVSGRSADNLCGRPKVPPAEVRAVAVERRTYRRTHLRMWCWTPVIGGGWRTGQGGYTFTKAGAARAGRRWHADDLRRIAHLRRRPDYYPADGGDRG